MTTVRARSLLGPTGLTLRVSPCRRARARGVVIHGFTQSRWSLVAALLPLVMETDISLDFLDAPGHGVGATRTAHPQLSLRSFLDGVAALNPDVVLGYSMGGRLALWAAATHPSNRWRVVAISANPGIPGASARLERRRLDEALASRLETLRPAIALGSPSADVAAFLDSWDAQPLFARRHLSEQARLARTMSDPRGWALALRTYGTGLQPDLVEPLRESQARLWLVVGGDDDAYRRHAARLVGRASLVTIEGAGHDVVAEAPERLDSWLRAWSEREFGP